MAHLMFYALGKYWGLLLGILQVLTFRVQGFMGLGFRGLGFRRFPFKMGMKEWKTIWELLYWVI